MHPGLRTASHRSGPRNESKEHPTCCLGQDLEGIKLKKTLICVVWVSLEQLFMFSRLEVIGSLFSEPRSDPAPQSPGVGDKRRNHQPSVDQNRG